MLVYEIRFLKHYDFVIIHHSNVSAPFSHRKYGESVTNNQTEIEAAIVAINVLKNEGSIISRFDYVVIFSSLKMNVFV